MSAIKNVTLDLTVIIVLVVIYLVLMQIAQLYVILKLRHLRLTRLILKAQLIPRGLFKNLTMVRVSMYLLVIMLRGIACMVVKRSV